MFLVLVRVCRLRLQKFLCPFIILIRDDDSNTTDGIGPQPVDSNGELIREKRSNAIRLEPAPCQIGILHLAESCHGNHRRNLPGK